MDTLSLPREKLILPSMIAWLIALGSPSRIFNCYCLVNILAWLALSAVLWDLLEVRDARTWISLVRRSVLTAGAIFSAWAGR